MDVAEIAAGLWRWTGRRDAIGGAQVGCVYQEGPDGIVLIDALVPPEDEERFLRALDRDVARVPGGVHVLTTVDRHARSADEIVERYGARRWRRDEALPNGIVAIDTGSRGEVAYWLPEHRALVCGDVVRELDGRLVAGAASPELARAVAGLGVERILVSHGAPVLEGAAGALAAALSPRRAG